MVHYFTGLAALVLPALLWTAWTGFAGGGETHVGWGLFAAVYTAAVHTLLILFVLVFSIVGAGAKLAELVPQYTTQMTSADVTNQVNWANNFFGGSNVAPLISPGCCGAKNNDWSLS